MKVGVITNSWGIQLQNNNLTELVTRARNIGAKHVELRQTFLGELETGTDEKWRPVVKNFDSLANTFNDMSFNLAIAAPFLSGGLDPEGSILQKSLEACISVSGTNPHLRLVDLTPQKKVWKQHSDIPEGAFIIKELASVASSQGITISIENSGQPIRALHMLVEICRDGLPNNLGDFLGLCPDPANQIGKQPNMDPLEDLEKLPIDMLKIVHFKQIRNGTILPAVEPGELDCSDMIQILKSKQYAGPAIFEIPSSQNVFENLSNSFDYIQDFDPKS